MNWERSKRFSLAIWYEMQRLRSSLKKSISIHGLPLKILIFPPRYSFGPMFLFMIPWSHVMNLCFYRILLRDIAWFSPLELPLLPLPLLGSVRVSLLSVCIPLTTHPSLTLFYFSGYSLRHLHDIKVDQRLQSIENSVCIHLSTSLSFYSCFPFLLLHLNMHSVDEKQFQSPTFPNQRHCRGFRFRSF